jgi:putative lipoprotein
VISNQSETESAQDNNQQVVVPEPPTPVPAPVPPPPPTFAETFANNNWLLESATVDGTAVDMNVNVPAALTLNFDKTKKGYSGFAGCNDFSGTYSASAPDNFSFGATVSTKKYCMESSGLESKVFSAMGKVQMFSITGGKLILETHDGKSKLVYKQAI